MRLFPYGSKQPVHCEGAFSANVRAGEKCTEADFVVVSGTNVPLLGRQTATCLGLLHIGPEVNVVEDKSAITEKYPDLFSGQGKLRDYRAKIHIDPQVKPVAQQQRRLPFKVWKAVTAKLAELEKMDVIEKVNGPTRWVSPLVVVPKPDGDVRICVDMRRVNEAIIRERHPIPTIDEVLTEMNGATVFSKLDLKWGYHQIELDRDSRSITTFATHDGLYRYKRFMFGISSSPELYQHVIQQTLQGCSGARNISDDISVFGRDTAEHDKRLDAVLKRLRDAGLTLNAEKCKFHMDKLVFMGHVLSSRGIGPDQTKVDAVREFREPLNVLEVRSFLGLVNCMGRFIPDLVTVADPLRRLTRA